LKGELSLEGNHNNNLRPLAEKLDAAQSILLTTHSFPDGDGLGSELALSMALRKLGHRVTIINSDPTPNRFHFLDPDGEIQTWNPGTELPSVDLALVLDTHTWEMVGALAAPLRSASFPVLFLDHHPCNARRPGGELYGTPRASSTGELVYEVISILGADFDERMAECLYVSISYDTNSFKYIQSQSRPLEVAARLIQCGVDTDRVYRHLFASNPAGKTKLLGELLARVRFTCDGRISYVDIPYEMIQGAGVETEALRDIVTHLLEVKGVEIAVVFKEPHPGEIKISLRSKGSYSINSIAEDLGGGGHPFASGVELDGPLDEIQNKVLEKVCFFIGEAQSRESSEPTGAGPS
jgi:phosphoesterase RecJ-like protein